MVLIKTSTGLVGLAVHPNPSHTLGSLYGKILRIIKKMPYQSAYRKYTEIICNERNKIVKTSKDFLELECKINGGQAEELIVQAENELKLARQMLNWKPWQPLIEKPPPGQWTWPPPKSC
ncbi:NADH dehydrogenase [ubiquinone] 1 alpha subcomplex subunit 5-like [Spodoptera frugiperda]|uniref:NADH dehydrogenase [ubiquinone] 1 alpha subcomplex subunit 5-like n=1 Tax=Spodoptera frugiperda TaxID=7108 RepID=A0A2H1WMG4_SPOFR|nr:NADH dehydrogenase [ubiquinone] 1 alpha subcomplex subunit 5-like [Spodoptera frugiperda]